MVYYDAPQRRTHEHYSDSTFCVWSKERPWTPRGKPCAARGGRGGDAGPTPLCNTGVRYPKSTSKNAYRSYENGVKGLFGQGIPSKTRQTAF